MARREPAATCATLLEEGYLYLDVRTVTEFNQGHPTGAYNIPAFIPGPMGMAPNPQFVAEVQARFAPDTPIVLGCRSGGRSLMALRILAAAGYTDLVDNEAGWAGAAGSTGWQAAGLPASTTPVEGRDYASLKR